jgi:hypothetical protein
MRLKRGMFIKIKMEIFWKPKKNCTTTRREVNENPVATEKAKSLENVNLENVNVENVNLERTIENQIADVNLICLYHFLRKTKNKNLKIKLILTIQDKYLQTTT